MASASLSKVGLTFKDHECDRILKGECERILKYRDYGGASHILELMSVIENHLGKFNDEVPSNLDGLSMIRDIAVKWFPGEAIAVKWGPRRGLEMHQPDLINNEELSGQVPVSNHGISLEMVRDHLRPHSDCTLFCDLVGKWSARSRHKGGCIEVSWGPGSDPGHESFLCGSSGNLPGSHRDHGQGS